MLLWASCCFFVMQTVVYFFLLHWRDKYVWFLCVPVKKLQICQSLSNQCACMEVFLNVCLVLVCKVSRSSSVCLSRLPLLQKAHFLPTTPAFFYCSSASLQSFPFLLISMMFPFSSPFSFTPQITHVWLYSFHSITPHICKLVRKGGSCFFVFHISLLLHI